MSVMMAVKVGEDIAVASDSLWINPLWDALKAPRKKWEIRGSGSSTVAVATSVTSGQDLLIYETVEAAIREAGKDWPAIWAAECSSQVFRDRRDVYFSKDSALRVLVVWDGRLWDASLDGTSIEAGRGFLAISSGEAHASGAAQALLAANPDMTAREVAVRAVAATIEACAMCAGPIHCDVIGRKGRRNAPETFDISEWQEMLVAEAAKRAEMARPKPPAESKSGGSGQPPRRMDGPPRGV
jgi:ATP-dependent protease HslVU (ClpYQ) peptidase subunit